MATVIPQVSIQDLVFKKSTPNTVGAIQAGLNLAGTFQGQQKEKRQEKALIGQQQLGQEVASSLLSGQANPQGMAQLLAQNPDMAAGILKQAGIVGQQGREQLSRTAFEIENIPAGSQRDARIQEIGAQLEAQGMDPGIALGLIGLSPEQQNKKLQSMQLAAMTPQQIQAIATDERNFGLEQQRFGLQQANAANQMSNRNKSAALNQKIFEQGAIKAQQALDAGVQIDAKGRQGINKDVTSMLKETIGIYASAKSLEGLMIRGSAASKLAAVFKFMKALDPTSVVRETEQGQVYSAEGAASQIAGMLNSLIGEGKLTERGFKDVVNTSKTLSNSALQSSTNQLNSYLETYENTLPTSFKNKMYERVPLQFQTISKDSSNATDIESLVNKYGD